MRVANGECVARREEMLESCRMSCGFCNRSAIGIVPPKDTANHGCPDGSDLGGGAYSVDPPPRPPGGSAAPPPSPAPQPLPKAHKRPRPVAAARDAESEQVQEPQEQTHQESMRQS